MSNLASALLAAQSEFPAIPMDSKNPHFGNKFASLGTIIHAVLPVLNRHGIVLVQHPTTVDGQPALRTCLIHAESDQHIEDTMLLVLDKQNSQGQGSALSYARRYAVMSTLGLVAEEDDDGAAASKPAKPKAKPVPAPDPDFAPDAALIASLGEIDVLADALAVTRKTDKGKVLAALTKEIPNWRTDPVDASRAKARLNMWAEKAKAAA